MTSRAFLSAAALLLASLLAGCGVSASESPPAAVLEQLPISEILERVAPAADRVGGSSSTANSSMSKDGERVIRHDEYSIDIGLKPQAVAGFSRRFCGELENELASRGRIQGGGTSGLESCSFHLVNQGVHAWVTVSPLLERGDRYWAMVVVDEW